jgi:hypothetical protein
LFQFLEPPREKTALWFLPRQGERLLLRIKRLPSVNVKGVVSHNPGGLLTFEAQITTGKKLALQPVGFEHNIFRNPLPLDLNELAQVMDGVGHVFVHLRIMLRQFHVAT